MGTHADLFVSACVFQFPFPFPFPFLYLQIYVHFWLAQGSDLLARPAAGPTNRDHVGDKLGVQLGGFHAKLGVNSHALGDGLGFEH